MELLKVTPSIRDALTRAALLLMLSVAVSCSPTTGTRPPSSPPSLTGFKALGLTVSAQEGFSVRLLREQSPNAGTVIAGVIGVLGGPAGIAVGLAVGSAMDSVSRRIDGRSAERLEPNVNRLDPEKVFRDRILSDFSNDDLLPPLTAIAAGDNDALQTSGVDGLLTVTIKQWGVRHCVAPAREEKVQAGLLYNGRIAELGKAQPLWERDELYLDGECYSLDDLGRKGSLLQTILSRALENAAAKFVNEVRYP